MAKLTTSQTRIGISGWTYPPWRGVFYPKKLPQTQELHYASRRLGTIEINGTFYSLQRPGSFSAWYDATPDDFVFSIKGGRFITHMKRLTNVEQPLANFWASGVLGLKEKLGPILWQLPPNFIFDPEKLDAFFKLLPREHQAAAKIAAHHDPKMKGRVLTTAQVKMPMRYAIEVRHKSFESAEFIAILREHQVALVIADTAGNWPYGEDVTADFIYMRLHGDESLYASGYTSAALDRWADRMKLWRVGKQPRDGHRWSRAKTPAVKSRDLFCYFDNDVKVKAPFDAMSLAQRLGVGPVKDEFNSPKLSKGRWLAECGRIGPSHSRTSRPWHFPDDSDEPPKTSRSKIASFAWNGAILISVTAT